MKYNSDKSFIIHISSNYSNLLLFRAQVWRSPFSPVLDMLDQYHPDSWHAMQLPESVYLSKHLAWYSYPFQKFANHRPGTGGSTSLNVCLNHIFRCFSEWFLMYVRLCDPQWPAECKSRGWTCSPEQELSELNALRCFCITTSACCCHRESDFHGPHRSKQISAKHPFVTVFDNVHLQSISIMP